jgi:hypothetical protein
MTPLHAHKSISALEFLTGADDAPTECKQQAKEALRHFALAKAMYEQTAKRQGEIGALAADATRNIIPTLRNELATSKKHSLVDLVAQQLKADENLKVAELEHRYAAQLLNSTRHQLDAVIRRERDSLLTWIATRRIADIHSHGHTELITPELEYIYEHLGIVWQPKWNEGLTLNGSRLPLVFHAGWTQDTHASVAWVWQHIALGDVRQRNTLHYVAAYVDSLPHIERPSQHTTNRKRFANS